MGLIGRQQSTGAFAKLDDISTLFDGSRKIFNLTLGGEAFFASNPFTLLVSVGGVIQEPNNGYTIIENQITFTTAPSNGAAGFIVVLSTVSSTSQQVFRFFNVGKRAGGVVQINLQNNSFAILDRTGTYHAIAMKI
tara:strand:- start:4678 stop:5085 length:408 start_codon:yes stop_codon:yes gene_type:complete